MEIFPWLVKDGWLIVGIRTIRIGIHILEGLFRGTGVGYVGTI